MSERDVVHFDASTFLAHRAIEAQRIGPPQTPAHVVLAGMRTALAHDRLIALQQSGRDEHAITARVNDGWVKANSERLEAHRRWAAGPYQQALEQIRQEQAQHAAEQLRRQARFDELTAG